MNIPFHAAVCSQALVNDMKALIASIQSTAPFEAAQKSTISDNKPKQNFFEKLTKATVKLLQIEL
jgi:hypothetical protein